MPGDKKATDKSNPTAASCPADLPIVTPHSKVTQRGLKTFNHYVTHSQLASFPDERNKVRNEVAAKTRFVPLDTTNFYLYGLGRDRIYNNVNAELIPALLYIHTPIGAIYEPIDYEWIKPDLSLQDQKGNTAFIAAIKTFKIELFMLFLDYLKNDPKQLAEILQKTDNDGKTALHYACELGQIEILEKCKTLGVCLPSLKDITMKTKKQMRDYFEDLYIDPDRDEKSNENYLRLWGGYNFYYVGADQFQFIPARQDNIKQYLVLALVKLDFYKRKLSEGTLVGTEKAKIEYLKCTLEIEISEVENLLTTLSGITLVEGCMRDQNLVKELLSASQETAAIQAAATRATPTAGVAALTSQTIAAPKTGVAGSAAAPVPSRSAATPAPRPK